MKKISLAFSLLIVFFVIAFFSCKKINEATELGSDLIPPVDNVNTFEIALDAKTNNLIFNDTTSLSLFDEVAVGHISNDPEFGTTHANAYFKIGRTSYGAYPFIAPKDSIKSIDSVVLSLAYTGAYGDTNLGSQLTIRVSEIAQGSQFSDTVLYKFKGTSDFATTGGELGSKTFEPGKLRKDSITIIRPSDTTKVGNVIRIPLSTSLGTRFKNYDTATVYKNDSLFQAAFKGFAIKADNTGNSLVYFDLTDNSKTKLIIYYKAQINGKDSSSSTEFYHIPLSPFSGVIQTNPANFRNGKANVITRTYTGNAAATLSNGIDNDDKLYIQSSPGTYVSIKIPGLDTLQNKVIHRAEVLATRINDAFSDRFWPPSRLMLDRINKAGDTAFLLHNDLVLASDGSIGFSTFGGTLKSDDTYRFDVTRTVQGIVTRHDRNDTLRLYAPLRTTLFAQPYNKNISIPVIDRIAEGRVVLAGGNYPDPKLRLRLRIIYSNL